MIPIASLLNPAPQQTRSTSNSLTPPFVQAPETPPQRDLRHIVQDLYSQLQSGQNIRASDCDLHVLQQLLSSNQSVTPTTPIPRTHLIQTPSRSPSSSPSRSVYSGVPGEPDMVKENVEASNKICLDRFYTYEDPETYIEYPETSTRGIGYLLRRNPSNWDHPWNDFVYSLGKPSGSLRKKQDGSLITHPLIGGGAIPCVSRHSTCQCFR
ncbi:hypothetical protein PQX77_006108 [Marasmius sp. AFHP31]|nr:hypothetical protein PQX77_006108 [Marasmius sp. AFHP31]